MNSEATDKASNLLQNGILIATNGGLVCVSLNDALSSNLNLSAEDLKTVAEQLILQEEVNKRTSQNISHSFATSLSSDATIDSDDPASDFSEIAAKADFVNLETSNVSIRLESHNNTSDSDISTAVIARNTEQTTNADGDISKTPPKRRGGWPKGRKRKPELLHLPPKAPATGYNLYLNDKRKQFKDSKLAFHEITKIIGNQWSRLNLEEKKPYLDRAEEDKRRYRDELRVYRQSGAYQLYLAKKRKKKIQNNVLSESDMDATDDIDDEDNEELYCRTCDQWFHNLHNKREHLQGRQHMQAVVGDMRSELASDYDTVNGSSFSTSLDDSSLDGNLASNPKKDNLNVTESIANLISVVSKREKEISTLKIRVDEAKAAHQALSQQLCSLREREVTLKNELTVLQDVEKNVEEKLFRLWQLPSLFITTDLNSCYSETSEYLTE